MTNKVLTPAPTVEETLMSLAEPDTGITNFLAKLSPAKLSRVKKSVAQARHGMNTVAPLRCLGPEKCLFIAHCPLVPTDEYGQQLLTTDYDEFDEPYTKPDYGDLQDYPVGGPCILEASYLHAKTIDYYQVLKVDPNNPIEVAIVGELATIDLYKNRAMMILSAGDKTGQGQDFMKTDVTGYTENGTPTQVTTLHPVLTHIDQLEKRRERWLDKLMQTREAQFKLQTRLGNQEAGDQLLAEMKAVRNHLESLGTKKIEVDTEIISFEED